jgi:hypothetical protein
MLRNSVDINELKNRQSFPKNNYFCYKWRIKDHFTRSIDRRQYELHTMGAGNDVSLMNDRILQLYKASFGTSRKDLIVGLAQDAMNFLDRRRGQQKLAQQCERALAESTLSLVHHVFNVLLAFSAELNSLMGLSELFITAGEPEAKKVGSAKEALTHVVQAGFSTNLYRLVIDGRLDCINFYIVPADTLLALQDITLNFNPLEKWHSKLYPSGEVYWFAGDRLIQDDMVEIICSELLRALIQATEERLMPPEQYVERQTSLFELAAPAPWEVDMQRVRSGSEHEAACAEQESADQESADKDSDQKVSDKNRKAAICSEGYEIDSVWQGQTGRGLPSLGSLSSSQNNPFCTPGLAEEIGLMTGCDLPCLNDQDRTQVDAWASRGTNPFICEAVKAEQILIKPKKSGVRKPARKASELSTEPKSRKRRNSKI